jgi:predicted kinase
MRGCPGSGKSTYISKNYAKTEVASADHFFIGEDGQYRYNPKLIGVAHTRCFEKFQAAIKAGRDVIVDNTNVKPHDMKRYVEAAMAAGAELEIVRIVCDPATAANRNTHKVSAEVVHRMYQTLMSSKLPADWPAEKVIDNTKTT